jgi:hypothetical protein
MNGAPRLFLCLACVLVGAVEAPRAMHVLAEDLRGPYECIESATSVATEGNSVPAGRGSGVAAKRAPAVLAWTDPSQGDADAYDSEAALVARGSQR